ncbi:MAG: hypothetical protein H0V53_09975 [Rubrobacter sp.]|nr:hypothetical protein [Rubrobacter sp.]
MNRARVLGDAVRVCKIRDTVDSGGYKVSPWRGLWFVLAVYAASRLFYLAAGTVLVGVVPIGSFQQQTEDVPFGTINLWGHWDGEHYARLASNGYLEPPNNVSPAFFPLYPLLIRSFAELFGGPVSLGALSLWGVLISLAVLPLAFYFVYRITEDGWGTRAAQGAVLALAFFPTSFFLNAAYTESLFLALSAGALWAARVRRDLLLAALFAGLATATRNVGVFLFLPLAYEWLRNAGEYRWRGLYLALAPSGLVAYMGYLWYRFGDPLLFYTDQADWGREATSPLATMENIWSRAHGGVERVLEPGAFVGTPYPGRLMLYLDALLNTYNLLFLLLAVGLVVLGAAVWRVLPLGLAGYALLLTVAPAFFGTESVPLMGMPRYVLVAFPLFIVLGVLLGDRRLLAGWVAASAALSLVFVSLFVGWWFVA